MSILSCVVLVISLFLLNMHSIDGFKFPQRSLIKKQSLQSLEKKNKITSTLTLLSSEPDNQSAADDEPAEKSEAVKKGAAKVAAAVPSSDETASDVVADEVTAAGPPPAAVAAAVEEVRAAGSVAATPPPELEDGFNFSKTTDFIVETIKEKVDFSESVKFVDQQKSKMSTITMRWITGLSLGAIGTLWIASGSGIFTLLFLFASLIAQNEYFAMVRATGVYPTSKTALVASFLCFLSAALFPKFHEIVMPLSAAYIMLWLLLFTRKPASINQISTSLLGTFYVGYMPSFWVRLRAITKLSAFKMREATTPPYLSPHLWTLGACATWWTWCSIVFADVGAYFIGKKYGKHKLSTISKAAGSASPNKTVEGAIGGFICCSILSTIGAFVMEWPLWALTGPLYGILMGILALVGDLTASMMKRDAGVKDSGNFFPGHGGLLDRFDSYMFTAPVAFFFCKHALPWIARVMNLHTSGASALTSSAASVII